MITAVQGRANMGFEKHTLSSLRRFQRNIIAKMVLGL
jgi:hypothetical protein